MNVNQVSKLFGDMNTQEVRTLELRVGQVVRGVVTQQLPNQEALVNINGVQIKAKLEIPILEGQATLMQVAPDSQGSFIHLKQVEASSLGLQDPMKEIIKAMNLPDKEWSNQLVRELRQEGFPLNKNTLQAFAQAAKLAPPNVDMESWMQAATLAFKRGMPMTQASISAMHQLSQGQPLHQLITQLQQQLTQLLQTQSQPLSAQTNQILQQLTNQLNQLSQVQNMNQIQPNSSQSAISGQQDSANIQAGQSNTQTNVQNNTQQQVNNQTAAQQNVQTPTTNNGAQAASITQNPIATFMKMLGVQHENQLSQQLLQRGEVVNNQTQTNNTAQQGQMNAANNSMQAQSNATIQGQGIVNGNANAPQISSQIQQVQAQPLPQNPAPIQQQIGTSQAGHGQSIQPNTQQGQVNQELQSSQPVTSQSVTSQSGLAQQVAVTSQQQMTGTIVNGQQVAQADNQMLAQQLVKQSADSVNNHSHSNSLGTAMSQASETMKATVMQALQLSDLPASIKEPLNQLLNHITGQQMMLSTERNQSMFTHITMYVPIKDEQGGQTAAIHVQTRRDRKGQLDAENCRIVFDLNMKQIGQTLVDLNVVNKIVSINIWNDASYIQPLVDSMRPEIIESMQKTGYSLSSIKTTPFKQEEKQELEEVKAIVQPPDVQHMSASRYKGVDLKV